MSEKPTQNSGNLRPFQPGQSPNPGGRPSQAALRAALKPYERQAVETLVARLDSKNERVSLDAALSILERLYGKPEASKGGAAWLPDDTIVEMLS